MSVLAKRTALAVGIILSGYVLADEAVMMRLADPNGRYLMSEKSNWYSGAVPSASLSDLNIRFFPGGNTVVNDLGDGFQVKSLLFLKRNGGGVVTGEMFDVGNGGITVNNDESSTVVTTRIESVIRACGATMPVDVSAYDVLYIAGGLTNAGASVWSFTGSGERHINCDLIVDGTTGDQHHTFSKGTTYIEGHMRLPQIETKDEARLVVRGNGVLETWNTAANSFFQGSTLDVLDGGRILLGGANCVAQDARLGTATFNVYTNGFMDTGLASSGYRCANNGHCKVNVNGGTLFWRATGSNTIAEHGKAELAVANGGRIVAVGKDGYISEFAAYNNGYRETVSYPDGSIVRLCGGGEFVCLRITSRTTAEQYLDVPVRFVFDGGTLVRTQNNDAVNAVDMFTFSERSTAERNQLRFHVREAGAIFDGRQSSTRWNAVAIRGTDVEDGTDGVFEKRGDGVFALAAPYLSSGAFLVRAGELAIENTEYFNGRRLELRPQASVSFSGTRLALDGLSVRDGIVRLAAGQSVSVEETPVVEGSLVFDVATDSDGTYTLMECAGMDATIAEKCRVLKPTVGKGAVFAVEDGILKLTIADGESPAAPALAASEDARMFTRKAYGIVSVDDATLDGREVNLVQGGIRYDGNGATFGADNLGVAGDSSITIGPEAGDIVFDGCPDLSFASEQRPPVISLASAPNKNRFVFTGDWTTPFPWTSPWFGFSFGVGDYQFGPGMTGEVGIPLKFLQNQLYAFVGVQATLSPATDATGATLQKPGYRSSVVLDGAHVKALSNGSGSLDDFFAGATSLALGADGAAFDTQGHDVTITQSLLPTSACASAGFGKLGEGTLALSGSHNVLYGPLVVSGGVLRAGFDTGMRKPYPPDAVAIWDFDGDDPYADKSGHGHSLEQAHPERRLVGFKTENAYAGAAAIFDNEGPSSQTGGSLCCSNIVSTSFQTQTISVRVRLASYDVNSGIVSTRVKRDFSDGDGTFDLAYKRVWKTNNVEIAGGAAGFGTIWGGSQASIWDDVVGNAPALDEWHHIVMIQDKGAYSAYLDGVRYVDDFKGVTRDLVSDGFMLTIGQGTRTGEFMHGGGMIDEVLVYPRALGEEEIRQLHEGTPSSADFDATVALGATWDLDGSNPTVRSLSGDGSIVNGTLTVTGEIRVGNSHKLSVSSLAIPEVGGVIDIGYGEEDRLPSETPMPVCAVADIDAASLANLQRWTVVGKGCHGLDRSAEFSIMDGMLMVTLRAKGLAVIIR